MVQDKALSNRKKVLVVDDSALMRKMISAIINSDSEFEVIATAHDGAEAISKVVRLKPDVVTLDMQMPKMGGMVALEHIMSEYPIPVVVISAYTQMGSDLAINALEHGAVEVIAKPSGEISLDINKLAEELILKLKVAVRANVKKLEKIVPKRTAKPKITSSIGRNMVIAIGASTGGPRALSELIPKLPADIPAGVLIAQHMPPGFTYSLAERLNWESTVIVKEASDADKIIAGQVLIAPGGYKMTVNENEVVQLTKSNLIASPPIDPLFESVAKIFGSNSIGIVMSGMGKDGLIGLKKIKLFGGYVLAQDEESCVVYGMPKAAFNGKVVDKVVSLAKMPQEILRIVQRN